MALNPALMDLYKNSRNKYSRSNAKTVKFPEGKTKIRIVTGGEARFWRDLGVHWIKTDVGGKPVAAVGCYDLVHEKPCPTCAAIEAAAKVVASVGDDEQVKLVKEMRARRSVIFNALVMDGANAGPTPQIVEMTPTTFDGVLSIAQTYADENIDIFDLDTGIDLIIERRGKGLDTEYTIQAAPVSKKVDKKAVATLNDLDEFIEKEFFRPDMERKGLTALADTFDVKVSLPKSTSALLSPPAGALDTTIEDAEVIEPVVVKAAAVVKPAAKPVSEPVEKPAISEEDEIDAMLKDLDVD